MLKIQGQNTLEVNNNSAIDYRDFALHSGIFLFRNTVNIKEKLKFPHQPCIRVGEERGAIFNSESRSNNNPQVFISCYVQ